MQALLAATPGTQGLLQVEPEQLKAEGIKAVALDFDGVLAAHGEDQPLPEVVAWLQRAVETWGEERIFILSNRPFGPRVTWFAEQFPKVRFIAAVRKKPYPDGLNKTGELAAVPLSSILMADDRLLTGCLCALLAGARPYYVRAPYVRLAARPGKELFFMTLRSAERLFVRLLG